MKLSIVTPCIRPQNLARIARTIPKGAQWIIVMDRPSVGDVPLDLLKSSSVEVYSYLGGLWGNEQRNFGMWVATGEFVYFLDDDNVIHPRLVPLLEQVTRLHAEPVLVMNQQLKSGKLRMRASIPPRPGGTDTAQVVVPRALALGHRWVSTQHDADGRFFGDIYAAHPERFVFVDEVACYYNYLRSAA